MMGRRMGWPLLKIERRFWGQCEVRGEVTGDALNEWSDRTTGLDGNTKTAGRLEPKRGNESKKPQKEMMGDGVGVGRKRVRGQRERTRPFMSWGHEPDKTHPRQVRLPSVDVLLSVSQNKRRIQGKNRLQGQCSRLLLNRACEKGKAPSVATSQK